jgi:hypothetical protein
VTFNTPNELAPESQSSIIKRMAPRGAVAGLMGGTGMIRALVADDHAVVRRGLRALWPIPRSGRYRRGRPPRRLAGPYRKVRTSSSDINLPDAAG